MAFTRIGFGQVEPNQLSAQKTGQIYASLPLDEAVTVLQNGEFMWYNYATNEVTGDPEKGVGEPMLVFNEIKIYEDKLMLKDFAMIRVGDNYVTNAAAVGRITSANTEEVLKKGARDLTYGDGALTKSGIDYKHTEYGYRMDGIAPRLFKTNVGDIFTTNMVDEEEDYAQGTILKLKANEDAKTLFLSPAGDLGDMEWVVAKVYTMPDGQFGVKIQRVK